MRRWITYLGVSAALSASFAAAQSPRLHCPETVTAGSAVSCRTSGAGAATLYIVGPGAVLQRKFQLGESVALGADDLHNAGRYVATLVAGSSVESNQFDVAASPQPGSMSFLAKPSRLPVNVANGVSGVAYLFDVFGNLILQPQQVSFELFGAERKQSRTATSQNGVAWVKMNSATKAGPARFQATTANIRENRVIQQVAGDPCTIRMTAHPSSDQWVELETDPVRDCGGNAVADGTIVSFTETLDGHQKASVDVPLKRGVARTRLPARKGAVIAVAAGVVMGNEIRWSGGL